CSRLAKTARVPSGIILAIIAMLVYLGMVLMLNPIYAKLNSTDVNQSYLAQLLLIRKREIQLETAGTNFYFLILSTGLALYLFEYALRMPTPGLILTYGITGSWILFNWFYFRPRIIQKNQEKEKPLFAKSRISFINCNLNRV